MAKMENILGFTSANLPKIRGSFSRESFFH